MDCSSQNGKKRHAAMPQRNCQLIFASLRHCAIALIFSHAPIYFPNSPVVA